MRLRRLARDEHGAVLVEFGIIFPLLMLIFCALIDFGLAVFTLNGMTAAVREGGRLAAVLATPVAVDNDTRVQQRVADAFNGLIITGDPIEPADVQVVAATQANGGTVRVTIPSSAYAYVPITPLANLMGLSTIPMGRSAVFHSEQAGFTP